MGTPLNTLFLLYYIFTDVFQWYLSAWYKYIWAPVWLLGTLIHFFRTIFITGHCIVTYQLSITNSTASMPKYKTLSTSYYVTLNKLFNLSVPSCLRFHFWKMRMNDNNDMFFVMQFLAHSMNFVAINYYHYFQKVLSTKILVRYIYPQPHNACIAQEKLTFKQALE